MLSSDHVVRRLVLPLCLLHTPSFLSISKILVAQPHAHPLPAVNGLLNRLLVCDLAHVGVVLDLELAAQVLRPEELGKRVRHGQPHGILYR